MSNVRYKNWTHSERRSSQRPKETFSTSGSARQPPSRAPPCFSCQSSQHDLSCYCADVFSLFRYDFQMFPAFSADIRSNVFLSVIETRLRASNLILLDPDALCSFFHSIELIWFQQQTIRAELFPSLRSRDVNIVWQLMCCAHTGMYNSVSGRTTFHGASVISAWFFFQIIPASAISPLLVVPELPFQQIFSLGWKYCG